MWLTLLMKTVRKEGVYLGNDLTTPTFWLWSFRHRKAMRLSDLKHFDHILPFLQPADVHHSIPLNRDDIKRMHTTDGAHSARMHAARVRGVRCCLGGRTPAHHSRTHACCGCKPLHRFGGASKGTRKGICKGSSTAPIAQGPQTFQARQRRPSRGSAAVT
jgi:hypothetical protein